MVARNRFRRTRLATGAAVILASLLIALWHPGGRDTFWQGIEGRFLDARFLWRGPVAPPDGVAILAFDDAAIARLQAFPPTRVELAEAVRAAAGAGARAIALDFLLPEARAGDADLIAVLSRTNAVLGVAEAPLGAALRALPDGGFSLVVAADPGLVLPALGPAKGLSDAATLGHVMPHHEVDGAVRRFDAARVLLTAGGRHWYPALAIAALRAAGRGGALSLRALSSGGQLSIGGTTAVLDTRGAIPLTYYGPAGTIPTYSAAQVGTTELAGKIVFVGATATGFGDRHVTPFDAAFPGVELHATLAANLLEQRLLRRDVVAWGLSGVLAVLVAAGGFLAAGQARPALMVLATMGVAVGAAAALQFAFVAGWWLDASTVLLALLLGVAAGAGLRLLEHRRRAANLARYQSPRIVERLAGADDPGFETKARPAVVVFLDVESFTSHSERLGPEGTARFLRMFHGLVEQAADPLGGTIAHFAGDGVMVVFGLPDPDPDDAIQALRFVETLFAALRSSADWPGLGLRFGGHCGLVQAAVVGGRRHRQLTVSGDVVNTASRLQDFTKSRGAAIALSEALVLSGPETRAWAERIGMQRAGRHRLRGRRAEMDIWTGPPPPDC